MPRFQFKLQKVLEARRSYEDKARRDFGEAMKRLQNEKQILAELQEQREILLKDMAGRRKTPLPAEYFVQDIQFEWTLRIGIREQKKKTQKAEQNVEERRKKLIEAMKKRKIMEKLREKKYLEFRKLVSKEEFKLADEIAGRKTHFEEQPIRGE